ncbi:MFS transporter [Amycolatopsis pigmentata]|uniref:MFS transporter n=1 Tax=Amycolatopsis pigmentata TaxID=450801 RepID=A0ABW5FRU6_9PSEU
MAHPGKDTRRSRTTPGAAALAAWIGTALEFYDLSIYAFAASLVFPKVFFPTASTTLGVIAGFATYGAGYLARPFGSVIWGHVGDRLGRKPVLLATVLTMGTATFLVGCLPGYAAIGVAAPAMLVILRLVQGICAAGEQSGAGSMALEHAPAHRRAFFSSFATSGNAAGALLANAAFLPLTAYLDTTDLRTWGWRIPFWASAILIVVGLVLRRRLDETPAFLEETASGQVAGQPLAVLFKHHWRALLRTVLLLAFSAVQPIVSLWALAYGKSVGVPATVILWAGLASTLAGQLFIPLAGRLADRIGRRPVFITGLAGMVIFVFPLLWSVGHGQVALIIVLQILVIGVFGALPLATIAALTGEMFPTRVRISGTGIGFQFGAAIAGGTSPVAAAALASTGPNGWVPAALWGAGACVIAAVAAVTARETSRIAMEDLGKASPSRSGQVKHRETSARKETAN